MYMCAFYVFFYFQMFSMYIHSPAEVGSNELYLLCYIFGVTNTFRLYLKMGNFTLTQVHF